MNGEHARDLERLVALRQAALALLTFASAALAQDATDATASLIGRVVDVLGEPIPAASVCAESDPAGSPLATGKTDGSGFFALAKLPCGDSARITVRAPGYVHQPTWVRRLQVRGALDTDLVLRSAGHLRGVVVDAAGKAVPFACVRAQTPFGSNRPETETTADAEGRFVLDDAPLGEVLMMTWQRGFVLDERRLFLRDETEIRIELTTVGGAQLAIKVTGLVGDADRSAVQLRLERFVDSWSQALPSALGLCSLDGNSAGTVQGLLPGKYQMIPISRRISVACATGDRRHAQLTIGVGQLQEVTFDAAAPDCVTVAGVLRDQDGTGLEAKELAFSSSNGVRIRRVRTDAQGRFSTVASLSEGEKLWPSLAEDEHLAIAASSQQEILVRGTQLDLQLQASACTELRGRVLDDQRRGQPGVRVALTAVYGGYGNSIMLAPERSEVTSSRADENGDFVLRWPRDAARLSALRIEVLDQRGCAVHDLDGDEPAAAPIEMRFRPPSGVGGCVRDAAGKPVGGVRMLVAGLRLDQDAPQRRGIEVYTDRLGLYRLASLPAGEYSIHVTLRGMTAATSRSPVTIKSGEIRTGIDFVVDP